METPLNPVDRAMLMVDRSLRSFGYPGFQTQMLLWLEERIDVERLRLAVGRFQERHPLVASRLVDSPIPHWQSVPGPVHCVSEAHLPSTDDDAVTAWSSGLLSTPRELEDSDPVQFAVLHRPDGRDVVLMQYNHVLLDNNATPRVIQQINELARDAASTPREAAHANHVWQYLRRYPIHRRREAARAAILEWRQHLQHGAKTLGRPGIAAGTPARFRLTTKTLDEHQTRALRTRATAVCGLPAISMTILASVFRAIRQMASAPGPGIEQLIAGIGVDLNLRTAEGPLFGNLMSLVLVRVQLSEVGARDELARMLHARLRDQLRRGIDLGILRQTTVMSRRPRALHWGIQHFLRHTCSLWYAYFGSLDHVGSSFCGAAIERICYFGPAWPPLGVTLLASTYHNRLTFGMTSAPASVPDDLAGGFLDAVLHDLVE